MEVATSMLIFETSLGVGSWRCVAIVPFRLLPAVEPQIDDTWPLTPARRRLLPSLPYHAAGLMPRRLC